VRSLRAATRRGGERTLPVTSAIPEITPNPAFAIIPLQLGGMGIGFSYLVEGIPNEIGFIGYLRRRIHGSFLKQGSTAFHSGASMDHVFISHADEDARYAIELAGKLESEGFKTWYYERDSLPGDKHYHRTDEAIERCRAFTVLISPSSITSEFVIDEIKAAAKARKTFFPLLLRLRYDEAIKIQPLLAKVIGDYVSLEIPQDNIDQVLPSILEGLKGAVNDLQSDRIITRGYWPQIDGIYGRDKLVDECIDSLSSGHTRMLSLYGMGGIGKSTLAALILHRLSRGVKGFEHLENFIWYNLRERPDLETAAYEILHILTDGNVFAAGTDRPRLDLHLDQLSCKLKEKPSVIVFDNMESTMSDALEPGCFADLRWGQLLRTILGTRSICITTSRPQPAFFEPGWAARAIEGIGKDDAVKFLKEMSLRDSDAELGKAWNLLKGHPMALKALAAKVILTPTWGRKISNAGEIMDAVKKSPDPVHNPAILLGGIIGSDTLPKEEYDLLIAMPFLFRPEKAEAIAALRKGEIEPGKVPEYLEGLVKRSLVCLEFVSDVPFYSLHPLVAEVAKTRVTDPSVFHQRAYDYYLSLPRNMKTKDPYELAHLTEAVKHALALKRLDLSSAILYGEIGLAGELQRLGRQDLALPLHREELAVASAVGDKRDQLHAAANLGDSLNAVGHHLEAEKCLMSAIDMAIDLEDRFREGECKALLGDTYQGQGKYTRALDCLKQALQIAVELGDRRNESMRLRAIGFIHLRRSEYDEALESLQRALDIAVEIGDRAVEGSCLGTIGHVHKLRANDDVAGDCFRRALDIAIELGDRRSEGIWLGYVGWTVFGSVNLLTEGDLEGAWPLLQKALDIAIEVGDRASEAYWLRVMGWMLKVHGHRLNVEGDILKGLEYFESSLPIAVEIGDRGGEGRSLGEIGGSHYLLGNCDKAKPLFERALAIAEEVGDRRSEGEWCFALGELMMSMNNPCESARYFERAYRISVELKLCGPRIGEDLLHLNAARAACEKLRSQSKNGSLKED
jgi:tetratricopeptide (TPR) repeat protein